MLQLIFVVISLLFCLPSKAGDFEEVLSLVRKGIRSHIGKGSNGIVVVDAGVDGTTVWETMRAPYTIADVTEAKVATSKANTKQIVCHGESGKLIQQGARFAYYYQDYSGRPLYSFEINSCY